MKRDQTDAPRNRFAETKANARRDGCPDGVFDRDRSESDDAKSHKTRPCSVVIQRLSEAALQKLIRQGNNAKSKKWPDNKKDAGTVSANPTAEESKVRKDVRIKKSHKVHGSRKSRSPREVDQDSLCRKDSCPTSPDALDEVSFRSEELSDIINFLIETDPQGRKDDYVKSIKHTSSSLDAPTPDVYGFAYDPKMSLSPEDGGKEGESNQQPIDETPPGSSPDAHWIATSSEEGCALLPRCSSDDNFLQPKPTQSFESLISTTDSEGRLVIDEGDDITPDSACLAMAYQVSNNNASAKGDTLEVMERTSSLTSAFDSQKDKASPENSCSDVASLAVKKFVSDAESCATGRLKEDRFKMSPLKSPLESSAQGTERATDEAEKLVWIPYIPETASASESASGHVNGERSPLATGLNGKRKFTSPDAKGASRKACLGSPFEKYGRQRHREPGHRKERKQPKRQCRSRSADAAGESSKFLTVYTTVSDGKITSVDCTRYSKRRRHSASRERASTSRPTSGSESGKCKRTSERQKEVDVYVTVSKVVREMVNATAREVQGITRECEIADPSLKHLFRAFCDSNGYKFEDFMGGGIEHTLSRVLKPDVGVTHSDYKRHDYSDTRQLTQDSASRPKKRKKGHSASSGKRILTRSQRNRAIPGGMVQRERERQERRDVFPDFQGTVTKLRVASTASEFYSSNTESSVDLSDAIATLGLGSDLEKPSSAESFAAGTFKTTPNPEDSKTPPNCDSGCDPCRAPENRTGHMSVPVRGDAEIEQSKGASASGPNGTVDSDVDEDRLVICDFETELERSSTRRDEPVRTETDALRASREPSLSVVSQKTAVVPPFRDVIDETAARANVSIRELEDSRTEISDDGSAVKSVMEQLLHQCDVNCAGGSATSKTYSAPSQENSTDEGCVYTTEEAELEQPHQEQTAASSRRSSYSADTETQDLTEPLPDDDFDSGQFHPNVVTKQEADDQAADASDLDFALDDLSEPDPLYGVPEEIRDSTVQSDSRDASQSVEESRAGSSRANEGSYREEATAPYDTEGGTESNHAQAELPEDEVSVELAEQRRERGRQEEDGVCDCRNNVVPGSHVDAERCFANSSASSSPGGVVNSFRRPVITAGSHGFVHFGDLRDQCCSMIKEEPTLNSAEGGCVVMHTSEDPLDLTVKELTKPTARSDVPVGTVHPQITTTDDDSRSHYMGDSDNNSPINYSCKSPDRRKAGYTATQTDQPKQDKPIDSGSWLHESSHTQSILQRLLLNSVKDDKASESATSMPVIIDVRSLRPELEAAQRHLTSDTAASGSATRHDSEPQEHQQSLLTQRRTPLKASVTVPPMTFPENRHGIITLESKILELKRQIYHLTILATCKEQELDWIRSLRLAKEEALKQLECKYPDIFSYAVVNRTDVASSGSASYVDIQEMLTKAATSSGGLEIDCSFNPAHQPTAFREVHPPVQPTSVDSGALGFRKIAPKQSPYTTAVNSGTATTTSTGNSVQSHTVPLAGPFWLPSILPASEPPSDSHKRRIQGLVAPQSAYQPAAFVPWWSTRSSPDSGASAGHSDLLQGLSPLSPSSSSLLDRNSVQACAVSPLPLHKQTFAEAKRSAAASDSEDCAPRTSRTLRRDATVSGCSTSDMYIGHPDMSLERAIDIESALQTQALHMYAEMLHANREGVPLDAAALLRDRQIAFGPPSSPSSVFCNAIDAWMKLSQSTPEGYSVTNRKSEAKTHLWNQRHTAPKAVKGD